MYIIIEAVNFQYEPSPLPVVEWYVNKRERNIELQFQNAYNA